MANKHKIQVEGENRIKEAKLKGDIEANIKCLNNEIINK